MNLLVQNVALGYGKKLVLEDVSLELRTGELVGLIGPNGSGKSTLIKAISGVIPCRAGQISINGQPVSQMSRRSLARTLAVVPQNPSLPDSFTVLETVLMGRYPHLGFLRYESHRDLAIAWHALEATGMENFAQHQVGEISGGERQRLLIARALAQETQVFLLDEPTAHLDIQHQLGVMELVQGLATRGSIVVAAIHDFSLAARFCQRLVLLKDGSVGASGSPEDVITAESVGAAFGVNALVYPNILGTGLTVEPLPERVKSTTRRLHIVGGGGRAARLMRALHVAGFEITTGVLNENDADCAIARALGIEVVTIPPFTSIDKASHRLNLEMVELADCTVVTDVPFGNGNLLNLKTAALAKRLVLIEDSPIEMRDFTGGEAAALYRELKKGAQVCKSQELLEVLAGLLTVKEEITSAGASKKLPAR